jgi:hypothetical protein
MLIPSENQRAWLPGCKVDQEDFMSRFVLFAAGGLHWADYTGFVGRITGVWAKSEANIIRVSLWHEISNFGDEIATFALVTGVSIDPTFQIGSRAYVSFELGYETRDFRGEPDLPGQSFPHRDDDVLTGTLRLEWRLTENSNISGEYRTQDRQSTRGGRDYDFDLVQLNFRVGL